MNRAPKGFTYDPCPGCDRVHQRHPRPRNGVCHECAAALSEVKKRKAEAAGKDTVCAMVPARFHWLPYISHGGDDVQKAFWRVALAASEAGGFPDVPTMDGEKLVTSGRQEWFGSLQEDGRTFSRDAALALRDLYEVLLSVIPAAYDSGKRDGTNLLAMLNSGELTNQDFERRAGISTSR